MHHIFLLELPHQLHSCTCWQTGSSGLQFRHISVQVLQCMYWFVDTCNSQVTDIQRCSKCQTILLLTMVEIQWSVWNLLLSLPSLLLFCAESRPFRLVRSSAGLWPCPGPLAVGCRCCCCCCSGGRSNISGTSIIVRAIWLSKLVKTTLLFLPRVGQEVLGTNWTRVLGFCA